MNKNFFLNLLLLLMALGLAFVSGFVANDFVARYSSEYPLLQQAVDIFQANALQPLPEQKVLEYGMIRGMLEAYGDPYTIFLEPPQHELQTDQLEGTFGGIGVHLERGDKGVLLYPFPEGPAAEAGVLNGDVLISVDGLEILQETTNDGVEAALRGPVGEAVHLAIFREQAGELLFDIKRQEAALPSVVYHLAEEAPLVGILKVKIIASTTVEELLKGVESLKNEGAVYFILDLRENGGGLLNAGIEVARLFLKEGVVIEEQYQGKDVDQFRVTEAGKLADIPLVVFVNYYTASAAEIVAGALQANGRAVLMGEPTYGKNTIQQVFELQDGSSLHVTSAHWWFPELEFPVDGRGLRPDLAGGQTEGEWIELATQVFKGTP
ncbi:MAG: PDZ domain-containing protein [Anaerolineales bacterium]|nr:PDZ domain-containing protein [Anaerolineales bacterium]